MRLMYVAWSAAAISLVMALCLIGEVANAVPTAKLPLTCSNPGDIGEPQNNCSGLWLYQLPNTDELIVLKGPSSAPVWTRAANLAPTDTVAVCSLPVEPGSYSSCKDSIGVRRLVYVAKSQIFTTPTSPPPVPGAWLLDLQRVPVEINQPGLYLLDRSWSLPTSPIDGAIVITADNVTLDLQGFELTTGELAVRSTGRGVTIRNGRVNADFGGAIRVSGENSRIERVQADVGSGGAVGLDGTGSILTDSTIIVGDTATGVSAGDDTIVRDNRIGSRFIALSASSRTTLVGNEIQCGVADPCIEVEGVDNTIRGNTVRETIGSTADGLVIRGNHNLALDNVFFTRCRAGSTNGGAAIVVEGRGNTLRENIVPSCAGFAGWGTGLRFLQDGNFYGDNTVWATVPFNLGATVQTDLGGNMGLGP